MPELDRNSTLRDVYANPLGRDILDRLLFTLNLPTASLKLVGGLRLRTLDTLATRVTGPGFVDALLRLLANEQASPAPSGGATAPAWWKEAVFYQVYPRSFQDSNGDGVGDLRGIINRLDYLRDLGVDCLWLSPIFDSPNEDMGYDVRDYRAIMAEMGTLEDADELIRGCHERGMRIILDLVVNHTSAEHEWFRRAIADPAGPYGEYYFLRSGPERPNNWTSFFSGPAWRYLPEIERWALRLFAPGQMDLNWENPAVRAEVSEIVQWWLARGIDGFRLDVINFISKQPGLPDGHPFVGKLMGFTGIEHYFYGPRLHEYLAELRANGFTRNAPPASTPRSRSADGVLGDPLPAEPTGVMVGETPGIGVETGRLLTASDRGEMDLIFNFDVLENPGKARFDSYRYDLNYLKKFYIDYESRIGASDWIALFFDNHDNPRMLSKVAAGEEKDPAVRTAVGKLLATIQLTMRGTPFLFQGQELGAVDHAFTSIADMRDIESINLFTELREGGASEVEAWAKVLAGSRDHARVPIKWAPEGGFTEGTPWLAGFDAAPGFSAAEQLADPGSILNWHRALVALRRAHPEALVYGDIEFLQPNWRDYFGYTRGGEFLIEVNLAGAERPRPQFRGRTELLLTSRIAPHASSDSGSATRSGTHPSSGSAMLSRSHSGGTPSGDSGARMAPWEASIRRIIR